MKFRTEIEIAPLDVRFGYENRTLALGSCFATHIADRLARARFHVTANPTGILFNPLSIAAAVRAFGTEVRRDELQHDAERWFHFGFHGDFAVPTAEEALRRMNAARTAGAEAFRTADRVILTLGTAWVYERNGEVVANCHRRPAAEFTRRMVSVEEIVGTLSELIEGPLADRHYKSAESVEVTAVSIHRNCMDYSSSCSFCLEKNEGVWLFSFDAEIDRSGGHTEAENQRIEEDAAEEILRIVKERQLVTRVKQYEVPPDDDIFALDETTYWTSFEFADGSSIDAPIDAGAELIDAFYSLAKIKIHQR